MRGATVSVDEREAMRRRAGAGFTILEVMLVIALIAMFMSVFVINFETLVRQGAADAVESTFWMAAREARTRALLERRAQSLRYDEKAAAFVVEDAAGTAKTFEIDRKNWAPDTRLNIQLLKRVASNQLTLVGGELIDTRPIPAVRYFPDGTCTPFLVELEVNGAGRTIEVDPWSGAELLADDDED